MKIDDSDSDASSSVHSNSLRVISVDNMGITYQSELFPTHLVQRFRIENLRPANSRSLERDRVSYNQGAERSLPSYRAQAYNNYTYNSQTPRTVQSSQVYDANFKGRTTYVRPPPIVVRAPKPKVIHVRDPPRIIQAPPQIYR